MAAPARRRPVPVAAPVDARVNELQLIRSELAAQRHHARALAASLDSMNAIINSQILKSYDIYLSWIIERESHRTSSHLERLRSRSDLGDTERGVIGRCAREFDALAAERASASAASAAPASAAHDVIARRADLMNRLAAIAEQLETVAASRYGIEDWRRTAHIDADSILEERRLRKNVSEQPHGRTSG